MKKRQRDEEAALKYQHEESERAERLRQQEEVKTFMNEYCNKFMHSLLNKVVYSYAVTWLPWSLTLLHACQVNVYLLNYVLPLTLSCVVGCYIVSVLILSL